MSEQAKNACGSVFRIWKHDPWEHCQYCGSLRVSQVLEFMKQPGVKFSGADWKYGWPHKFTFEVPNPTPDVKEEVGSMSGPEVDGTHPDDRWSCFAHGDNQCACPKEPRTTGYWRRVKMGVRTHKHVKFYNDHLKEATPAELEAFNKLSGPMFGITFEIKEGKVWYRARNAGIQLWGGVNAEALPDHSSMALREES